MPDQPKPRQKGNKKPPIFIGFRGFGSVPLAYRLCLTCKGP